MSGIHRLRRSVKKLDVIKQDEIQLIPAVLGLTIGGSQKVAVPTRPGFVYCRVRSNLNEVVQAYNDQVANVYDLSVLIARDKVNKTQYYVAGRDIGRYQDWGASAYVPDHHMKHEFNPEGSGTDIVWVYHNQMVPYLVFPTGTGGDAVMFYSRPVYDPVGASWSYSGTQTLGNILAYKPTNANAKMMLTYIDSNDTLTLLEGSELSASSTGTAAILAALPALPTDTAQPVCAIRMVSGTSSIEWENLYDLRQFLGGAGAGTPTLPNTAVGYGSATNELTGNAAKFFFNPTFDVLAVGASAVPDIVTPAVWAVKSGGSSRMGVAAYGGDPVFSGWAAAGTQASPGDLISGSSAVWLSAVGYTNGNWQNARAIIKAVANETWQATQQGMNWQVQITPAGGFATRTVLEISGGGADFDLPVAPLTDTQTNIEALADPHEGGIAFATDINKLGYFDGTSWRWFSFEDLKNTFDISTYGDYFLKVNAAGDAIEPATRQITNAYTPDDQSAAYTGIDNTDSNPVYATVADLNTLRTAYENLRASYDDLLQKLKDAYLIE